MSLVLENYSVNIADLGKQVLDSVNFVLKSGEIVVLVGENGAGKSSFALSLLGLPEYERSGSVKVCDVETLGMKIDEIAKLGLFVSFQAPPEIEGVTLYDFVVTGYRSIYGAEGLSTFKLKKKIRESTKSVGLDESFLERFVNQGFSGGERRKSEVMQMLVLKPKVAVLDEVDSGLDIPSTLNIAKILHSQARNEGTAMIVISHSPEFIRMLSPDRIVELRNKKLKEISLDEISRLQDQS